MEQGMKANGRKTMLGVKVSLYIKMVILMKVSGLTARHVGKGNF